MRRGFDLRPVNPDADLRRQTVLWKRLWAKRPKRRRHHEKGRKR